MKTTALATLGLLIALCAGVSAQTTTPTTAPTAAPVMPTNFTSPLPLLIIQTGGKTIVDEPKTPGTLAVISKAAGSTNRPGDTPTGFNGPIGIEVRGTTSQRFPKKQYLLETRDQNGKDVSVSLLGLPPGSNWVLLASYTDPSLLRDAVGYNLSRRMGHYASRTVPVEVMLNGQYQGVYTLAEKLEAGPNRIALGKQGVLLQITPADRVKPGAISFKLPESGTVFVIESPKGKALSAAAKAEIEQFTAAFAAQLYHPDPAHPEKTYLDYVDLDALVDFVLLNEFLKNADALYASTYVTRDLPAKGTPASGAQGKLVFGPVWDLDRSMGNSGRADLDATSGWTFQQGLFTEVLYDNPTFVRRFTQRWHNLRRSGVIEGVFADLDRDARLLADPARRNFARWPVAGTTVIRGTPAAGRYPEEVADLKAWLTARAQWMDTHIDALIKPGW
ncbi:CotH kinase family protein [Deinococcus navajonensis]|uniref:CotH kinase family protein n=1 Tax=Deinococcus navajonensis TaxID=309884 RepID=A0ABV8XK80_9DEIO